METQASVARIILQQLGGNKFVVMTGAKHLMDVGNGLSMALPSTPHFVKDGINRVVITLTPMDEYDIEFIRVWGRKTRTIYKAEGVYCDQLCEIFEEHTGLRTRLF